MYNKVPKATADATFPEFFFNLLDNPEGILGRFLKLASESKILLINSGDFDTPYPIAPYPIAFPTGIGNSSFKTSLVT